MDSFARWPLDRRQFSSRTGTWICHLTRPVDTAPPDRRTFYLQFKNGPAVRTLELRTSAFRFATDPNYAPSLIQRVNEFLDSNEVDKVLDAFESAPQS